MNKSRKYIFLCLASIIIIPCVLSQLVFDKLIPYLLPGKQFLVFYLFFMFISYVVLIISRLTIATSAGRHRITKLMVVITLVIACSRSMQGISNDKPIEFLVVLTLIHLLILFIADRSIAGSDE